MRLWGLEVVVGGVASCGVYGHQEVVVSGGKNWRLLIGCRLVIMPRVRSGRRHDVVR